MVRLFAPPDAVPAPAAATAPAREQWSLPCCVMRGGSSRGGFFLVDDLPRDPVRRDAVLLACYGSPDDRQIDGIGGADPLTSKAALVAPSARPDADVEYTFCQVGIDRPQVSTGGNCGNMLSGVGPFAILRGLVPATAPETLVRIYTTNTGQVVTARVPVGDGLPLCEGDCAIAGVPDTGAAIRLDFGDCAGAMTGRLLPTGRPVDTVVVDGTPVEVSLVDAATAFVYVRAADVGATGGETPDTIRADTTLMARLEAIRGWAAVQVGLVERPEDAAARTPNVPRVVMVSPPRDYTTPGGLPVAAADVDVVVRQLAMQRPHKALAVTGAVCASVASALPGSVVHACSRPASGGDRRLGHPGGVMTVAAEVVAAPDGGFAVRRAEVERTARLIMDGTLYVRHRKVEALAAQVEAS